MIQRPELSPSRSNDSFGTCELHSTEGKGWTGHAVKPMPEVTVETLSYVELIRHKGKAFGQEGELSTRTMHKLL